MGRERRCFSVSPQSVKAVLAEIPSKGTSFGKFVLTRGSLRPGVLLLRFDCVILTLLVISCLICDRACVSIVVVLVQVILDPRVWRKDEGSDAAPRRREPVQCIKRDIVEALLQVSTLVFVLSQASLGNSQPTMCVPTRPRTSSSTGIARYSLPLR